MIIKYPNKLVHGRLIKRYKRFLADIITDDNVEVTAHCTNSGSMKTCLEENAEVYMSPVNDPARKTKFTWEMIKINNSWVGINTNIPNKLSYEAIKQGKIEKLRGYDNIKKEVKYNNSRIDLFLENDKEKCFVEVKNVTMKEGDFALFPDAVTKRGSKHLNELIQIKNKGIRAVMLYIVQRTDVSKFSVAKNIDPEYSKNLLKAIKNGVEVIAIQVEVNPEGINIKKELEFVSNT